MSNFADDLLLLADELIARDPKRPKQASLRRSISNSYYAIFHCLIKDCCELLVPSTPEMRATKDALARAFGHGAMKNVCAEILKSTSSRGFLDFAGGFSGPGRGHLERVADHFINLQEERHRADYDLSKRIDKITAKTSLTNAKAAIREWRTLLSVDSARAHAFAVMLLHWKAISQRKT
jgi:uncharacterized protein (UPF0332 family)